MKAYRLFALLRGYDVIEVRGGAEKVLNAAASAGVPIMKATRTGLDTVVFRTDGRGSLRVKELGLNSDISVSERRGMSAFLSRHRRRAGFLAGVILFFGLIFFLSGFVWDVNVYGLETVPEREFYEALAEEKIEIGALVRSLDKENAELSLLLAFPGIKWLQLETVGTTVNVYLKEGVRPPETETAEGETTDIVAAKDGVIVFAAAYNGIPEVRTGQSVGKGELLISGRYMTYRNVERRVKASGKVLARTVNVIETEVPLCYGEPERTGDVINRRTLRLFAWELPLYDKKSEIPFERFERITEKKQFSVAGIKLPFFETTESFYGTTTVKVLIGEQTALEKAEKIVNKLQSERFSGIIINDSISEHNVKDGVLYYTRWLYCTEDIALAVPADLERVLPEKEY